MERSLLFDLPNYPLPLFGNVEWCSSNIRRSNSMFQTHLLRWSKLLDGGWTDVTSGRASNIEIFARAVVKDRRLEIITKNLRRPGKYLLLSQNLGQPYIIWFVRSLKFIINSTHSKKITVRFHPVRNVRCFSYCKMNSAEELNFFCIIKHSLMAAKLNSRFLRIKKKKIVSKHIKIMF